MLSESDNDRLSLPISQDFGHDNENENEEEDDDDAEEANYVHVERIHQSISIDSFHLSMFERIKFMNEQTNFG